MLFVAKVLYLLDPDSGDKQGRMKEGIEQEAVAGSVAREAVEHEAHADGKAESDKEENEEGKKEHSKPATLLWLIQKLSRIAKLEAAYSPRNPLKVWDMYRVTQSGFCVFLKYFSGVSDPPKFLGTFAPKTEALSAPQ